MFPIYFCNCQNYFCKTDIFKFKTYTYIFLKNAHIKYFPYNCTISLTNPHWEVQ